MDFTIDVTTLVVGGVPMLGIVLTSVFAGYRQFVWLEAQVKSNRELSEQAEENNRERMSEIRQELLRISERIDYLINGRR